MCLIPKPNFPSFSKGIIPKPPHGKEKNVLFSFSALEKNKYFNIDSTCANWASDLFDILKNISEYTKTDLIQGKAGTCRVHNHEAAKPPSKLPNGIALKDFYQIRISKSKGGIHGVFYENVFYIIWFDPLHNMYPDQRYGGLRVITPPKTCCADREERIEELQKIIMELKEECRIWQELASQCEHANHLSKD